MAFDGEINWIGKDCPDHVGTRLQTKVMQSAAGYFVATQCPRCRLIDPSPHSRESHYYPSAEAVEQALADNTVRWRDTGYHPGPIEIDS